MQIHDRGNIASRYIPSGSRELADTESDAVVYLGERNGVPYAIAYCGKRAKPDWHYSFKTGERRAAEIERYFTNRRASLAYKAERKAKAKETPSGDNGYIELAQVSRMLKTRLQREFPGVRFSVRSESYSGGSSIDIHWSDGPTTKQVEAISDAYKSRGFDGMIDMAYSYHHWLLPNGDVVLAGTSGTEGGRGTVPAWECPKPHPDAKAVRLSSGYVSCHREVTDKAKAGILAAWRTMSPHERFKLYSKVRPDAGQYHGPGGWPELVLARGWRARRLQRRASRSYRLGHRARSALAGIAGLPIRRGRFAGRA